MKTDKCGGKKIVFRYGFAPGVRNFRKLDKMKNISTETLKKTKTLEAALYRVSLLSNMAILGFILSHFLNKMLRYTLEKDKAVSTRNTCS